MTKAQKAESQGTNKDDSIQKLDVKITQAALSKVDHYVQNAFKDGSWAYKPGDSPCIEPTAYCAIARRKDEATRKQVIDFLCANQNADGGWSTSPGLGKSDWTTGLALLALRILVHEDGGAAAHHGSAIQKAVEFLFEGRTEFYGLLAKTLLYISKGDKGLNYPRGWPWSQGCFHWVEPTSYTLLALKIPSPIEAQDSKRVLDRADNFLLEHACKDGGWNHGNDLCLNVYLPPYAVTTAEALIALRDKQPAAPIARALKNLSATIGYNGSAMSLAWVTIAHQSYAMDTANTTSLLIERQSEDGSFGPNLMVTALSMLALQAHLGDNALKV